MNKKRVQKTVKVNDLKKKQIVLNKKNSPFGGRGAGLVASLGQEAQLQIALMNYIKAQYKHEILAIHVPNDMTRTPAEGYVKKLMGMVPGFPDLILLKKPKGVQFSFFTDSQGRKLVKLEEVEKIIEDLDILKSICFVELKTEYGKLSENQKVTQALLRTFGFTVKTTYGIDQSIKVIDQFALSS